MRQVLLDALQVTFEVQLLKEKLVVIIQQTAASYKDSGMETKTYIHWWVYCYIGRYMYVQKPTFPDGKCSRYAFEKPLSQCHGFIVSHFTQVNGALDSIKSATFVLFTVLFCVWKAGK